MAVGDISSAGLVSPLSGQGLSALMAKIEAGETYVNILTDEFPSGEIRGQVR